MPTHVLENMTVTEDSQQKSNNRFADEIAELDSLLSDAPAKRAAATAETVAADPTDAELAAELLVDLDLSGLDLNEGAIADCLVADPHPDLSWFTEVRAEWEGAHANWRRARHAAEQRNLYRQQRKAEGHEVQPYRKHEHAPHRWGETVAEFTKRLDRERHAVYRGTTSAEIEERRAARPKTAEEKRAAKAKAEQQRRATKTPEQKAKEAEQKRLKRAVKRAAAAAKLEIAE